MEPGGVIPFDLQRMLIGDQPLLFTLEIVFRTAVVYAYALLLLRWLGSRTIGQLSTVEFLLVIALGSAVGDAMFYPEVPLLHALIVVTLVVLANKGLDILIARSRKAKRVIDGKAEELIVDGVISRAFLERDTLGVSEILQQLRHHGVQHLGQVRFAYVEPDGEVTVFHRTGKIPPGLPAVPPWEVRKPPATRAGVSVAAPGPYACMRCGNIAAVAQGDTLAACANCGHDHWTPAVSDDPQVRDGD